MKWNHIDPLRYWEFIPVKELGIYSDEACKLWVKVQQRNQ